MADQGQQSGWLETLLGFVIIIAVIVGLGYLIHLAYAKFYKPAPVEVSLSAYFVDDAGAPVQPESRSYENGHVKIKGDAYQGGQPIKNGYVRVTVSSVSKNEPYEQSISIPFKDGHFETDDPAFRGVRPGMPEEVKAEVSATGLNQTATVNLNSKPPVDKSALEWGLLAGFVILSLTFFVSFTGKKKAWRNQTAIIFSYVIIGIFLAVPLLGPFMLVHTFPDAVDAMIGAPAGLINTHTPNQPEGETQWALNIGGYSFKAKPKAAATPNQNPTANIATQNSTTPQGSQTGTGTPGVSQGPPSRNATPTTPAVSPAQGDADIPNANSSVPPAAAKTQSQSSNSDSLAPVVEVQGGLVIPLYVIILSVIGGAINMTRKVPAFQKEGEESDFRVGHHVSNLGTAVMKLARISGTAATTASGTDNENPEESTKEPAKELAAPPDAEQTPESIEDQAKAIEAKLDPLVTAQIQRNCETDLTLADIRILLSKMEELYAARKSGELLLKFDSFEDWAASHPRLRELLRGSWRVELLNQYMYLISAPFLAIVTYYILDLLGLSRQGVVVILSFSVGLISEKIVSWILGVATGYMHTDTNSGAPAKV